MTGTSIIKKISIAFIWILIAGWIFFRYTPYIFPVTAEDIARENFHSIKFYDRQGILLQELLSQNHARSVHIDIDEISPYFLDAIIAAEDKNFYLHNGIDYRALLRALWQNLSAFKIVSGASTITLQLARLIHPAERTHISKIKESYFAFRMEAGMSKRDLLEAYVNRLPMGGNLYGLESAARTYFGISASELTLAQASLLAAIPKSPHKLNPYKNMKELLAKRQTVLQRMVQQDFISTGRMKGVLKEKTTLKPQTSTFQSPHMVFYLAEKLTDGAQTVETTLDAYLQAMVREQISLTLSKLKPFHVTNAAVILLDNHSGELLAYCGSADYFDSNIDGQYDAIQALRQPGSALKPFLYLLAMEEGMHPASLISDVPSHYRMPTGVYSPKNYSENFHGPIRLREALANSLNVPAVRTLAGVGVENFLRRLKRYEFQSLQEQPEFYGLGLALGCGEVSLYELTRAYMCLARLGKFQPVREFIHINGKKIDLVEGAKRISSETLNYLIFDILNDNFARTSEFGFHSVLNFPFPCAVKTGTSFRFCDNWTIGYTADYTLGVWVGNFDHTPMLKVSGISGAGPLFARIMLMLYSERDYPVKPVRPEGIRDVTICLLSGRRPGPYCSTIGSDIIPEDNFPDWNSSTCLMHEFEAEKASVRLPRQYQDWAGQLGLDTEPFPMDQAVFEIVNPKAGAIYRRLPNLAPGHQSIRFQLRGSHPDLTVRWFLNHELIKTTREIHEFLWQSAPGEYTLRAVSASDHQLVSTVEFRVQ